MKEANTELRTDILLQRVVPALLFGAAAFLGYFGLLTKGYSVAGMVQAAVWFAPLLAIGVIVLRRQWLAVLTASLVMTVSAQIPLVSNLGLGTFASGAICALAIAAPAMSKSRRSTFKGTDSVCMMLVTAVVYIRFICDRPGSALLGDSGGLREAIRFVLGVTCYHVAATLAAEDWDMWRNWRLLVFFVGAAALHTVVLERIAEPRVLITHNVFGRAAWLLCSMLLAWAVYREGMPGRKKRVLPLSMVLVFVTLGLAVTTKFRSRPAYGLAIVGSIFLLSGQARRLGRLLLPLTLVIALLAGLLITGRMPKDYLRTLSTVVPVADYQFRQRHTTERVTAETGWQSEWRMELWKLGFEKMAKNPVIGKGFTFSREELLNDIAMIGGTSKMSQYGGLIVAGGFHNTLIQTGVFLGIPCALLFVAVLLFGSRDFLRTIRGLPLSPLRMFCIGLFAYFLVSTGQMLINGAAVDFWQLCTLLGIMKGISARAPSYEFSIEEALKTSQPVAGKALTKPNLSALAAIRKTDAPQDTF